MARSLSVATTSFERNKIFSSVELCDCVDALCEEKRSEMPKITPLAQVC